MTQIRVADIPALSSSATRRPREIDLLVERRKDNMVSIKPTEYVSEMYLTREKVYLLMQALEDAMDGDPHVEKKGDHVSVVTYPDAID